MKYLGLLLIAAVGSIAQASPVHCEQRGSVFSIVNADHGVIGPAGLGFEHIGQCEYAIAQSDHQNLICSWNGHSYQMFNTDNGIALGADVGYVDLPSCAADVRQNPVNNPYVCAWDGHQSSPYSTVDNKHYASGGGWTSTQACVADSVMRSNTTAICGWNSGPQLYRSDGRNIPYTFASLNSCNSFHNQLIFLPTYLSFLDTIMTVDSTGQTVPPAIHDGEPNATVGFNYWRGCGVRGLNYHLARNVNGQVVPECMPDTVYSWGGWEKLEWFRVYMANGQRWPNGLSRTLFTALSAAATFGYGDVPIRIKLKPNLRSRIVDEATLTCDLAVQRGLATPADFQTTLFTRMIVRPDGLSLMEYMICSPKIIESWSFGTAEHYDEILRDFKWMTTHPYRDWEGYSKQNGVDMFIGNWVDNGPTGYNTDFSQARFNQRMSFLRLLAQSPIPQVSSESGAADVAERHFHTARPIYFNPD